MVGVAKGKSGWSNIYDSDLGTVACTLLLQKLEVSENSIYIFPSCTSANKKHYQTLDEQRRRLVRDVDWGEDEGPKNVACRAAFPIHDRVLAVTTLYGSDFDK